MHWKSFYTHVFIEIKITGIVNNNHKLFFFFCFLQNLLWFRVNTFLHMQNILYINICFRKHVKGNLSSSMRAQKIISFYQISAISCTGRRFKLFSFKRFKFLYRTSSNWYFSNGISLYAIAYNCLSKMIREGARTSLYWYLYNDISPYAIVYYCLS